MWKFSFKYFRMFKIFPLNFKIFQLNGLFFPIFSLKRALIILQIEVFLKDLFEIFRFWMEIISVKPHQKLNCVWIPYWGHWLWVSSAIQFHHHWIQANLIVDFQIGQKEWRLHENGRQNIRMSIRSVPKEVFEFSRELGGEWLLDFDEISVQFSDLLRSQKVRVLAQFENGKRNFPMQKRLFPNQLFKFGSIRFHNFHQTLFFAQQLPNHQLQTRIRLFLLTSQILVLLNEQNTLIKLWENNKKKMQ